jgi:hypothetical protein
LICFGKKRNLQELLNSVHLDFELVLFLFLLRFPEKVPQEIIEITAGTAEYLALTIQQDNIGNAAHPVGCSNIGLFVQQHAIGKTVLAGKR